MFNISSNANIETIRFSFHQCFFVKKYTQLEQSLKFTRKLLHYLPVEIFTSWNFFACWNSLAWILSFRNLLLGFGKRTQWPIAYSKSLIKYTIHRMIVFKINNTGIRHVNWYGSGVFITDFKHIKKNYAVLLLLTQSNYLPLTLSW